MLDKLKKSKPTVQAVSTPPVVVKSPGAGTPANTGPASGPSPAQTAVAAGPKGGGSGRKTLDTSKSAAVLAVDPKSSNRKRKQKIISTGLKGGLNPKERLYCVCKKPYDDRK